MKSAIYYKAFVKTSEQIDEIIHHFDDGLHKTYKVDFPFDNEWLSDRVGYKDDYEYHVKRAYHEWAKGCGLLHGKIPNYFKGIIVDLDPEAGGLGIVFGRFGDNDWRCQNCAPAYRAEATLSIHAKAIQLLKDLEPLVDRLEVDDTTGIWRPAGKKS